MRPVKILIVLLIGCGLAACGDDTESHEDGREVWSPGGIEFDDPSQPPSDRADTVTSPEDTQAPSVETTSPGDTVGPPPTPELPAGSECHDNDDCPLGWTCDGGVCAAPGDCEATGTCPEDTGGVLEVHPTGEVAFSFLPNDNLDHRRALNLYNTGDGPLIISHVGLTPETPQDFSTSFDHETPVTLHAGDQARVEVVFRHTSPVPSAGTLEIHSNDSRAYVTRIALVPQPKNIIDQPDPCIQVHPTSLDFGQVIRGETHSIDFTVRSCGEPVLRLEAIERGAGGGFFGGGTPSEFQLAPPLNSQPLLQQGMQYVQTVTFTGGLAGVKTGHFVVKSSDPAQPEVRVDVRAESIPPPIESQGIHVELVWDSNNCDVDLHFLRPGGTFNRAPGDCHWRNMSPSWGDPDDIASNPYLDVDNVWGYGPENINFQSPSPGEYTVIVHYFSDSYAGSPSTPTNATIRIYHYGNLEAEFGPTHLAQTGVRWDVCTIHWPSMTITEIGTVN